MAFLEEVVFRNTILEGLSPQEEGDGLTTEAVQGAALALEGIHHIHGGHSLPAGVLGVGHGITHNILQEHLEDATGLLVDEAADTLHTTTTSQTPDGWLGDALDIITKDLPVTLSATLAKTLSALAASRHVEVVGCK